MRADILTLKLKPGEILREEELSAQLEISKTPIRAALASLEREGLIEIRPYSYIRVTPVDADHVERTFHLKNAIESYCYRLIIPLSAGAIREAKRLLDEARRTEKLGDEWTSAQLKYEFHRHFVTLANIPILLQTFDALYAHQQRARMAFSGRLHGSSHGDMERYHRRILDALIAKDVETAHAVLVEHASLFSKAIGDGVRSPQAVAQ